MTVRAACFQCNVVFNDPKANADTAVQKLESLSKEGVQLVLFPEAFLTGYCVGCEEDAAGIALEVHTDRGVVTKAPESVRRISDACQRLGMHAVAGYAGRENGGLYNGAILFQPSGTMHGYKKTHLPHLGFDRFVKPGEELLLVDTEIGKIGVLICFDMRYPEPTRALALAGADIIALPTNWPVGAEVSAQEISVARAAENRVFFLSCNRVGQEHGFRFIGGSKIVAPSGKVLAGAGDQETTIVADLDLSEARKKLLVNIPGEYEIDVFACRNPSLYGDIELKTDTKRTAEA